MCELVQLPAHCNRINAASGPETEQKRARMVFVGRRWSLCISHSVAQISDRSVCPSLTAAVQWALFKPGLQYWHSSRGRTALRRTSAHPHLLRASRDGQMNASVERASEHDVRGGERERRRHKQAGYKLDDGDPVETCLTFI